MPKEVIAAEVAEDEFARFVETMDLDVDPAGWDDEDKKSFVDAKRKIINAMMRGQLVIDDKGQPVFTPVSGEPITFYEPKGSTFMAMDQKKKGHDTAKMFVMMADMTRQNAGRFSSMAGRDIKVCMAIMGLFLA
jgi:hypothetical protein